MNHSRSNFPTTLNRETVRLQQNPELLGSHTDCTVCFCVQEEADSRTSYSPRCFHTEEERNGFVCQAEESALHFSVSMVGFEPGDWSSKFAGCEAKDGLSNSSVLSFLTC